MHSTIRAYFDAFNDHNVSSMLECLDANVAHHLNEGQIRIGIDAFREFCEHMNQCYHETLTDIVIFSNEDGDRAAAEYIVNGTYLKTDAGLPRASGQKYRLPAGSFFTLQKGKVIRVVTYYNLADWTAQVS